MHLAVVPAALLPPGPQRHPVLHESEQLKPGLYGADPHRTAAGSEIAVTPWSVIAQEVLRDEETAAHALALQDAVGAEVGAEVDMARLDPGWALAMAVAQMPELSEVQQDAARLVRDAGPVGPVALRTAPDLARAHADLIGDALGRSTGDLLAAAREEERAGAADTAWTTYLFRVLDDDDWLRRPGGVPLPPETSSAWRHTAEFLERIGDRLERLAEGVEPGGAPPASDALLVLRLADAVIRCGAGPADEVARAAQHTVRRCASPLLLDHATARELVDAVGPLAEPTQLAVVRPAVAAAVEGLNRPRGERVQPAVLRWLFPVPPRPPADEGPADALLRELAAQVTAVVADPSAFARQALVDAALEVTADATAAPAEAEIARLVDGRRWPPAELRSVARHAARSPAIAQGPAAVGVDRAELRAGRPARRPRPGRPGLVGHPRGRVRGRAVQRGVGPPARADVVAGAAAGGDQQVGPRARRDRRHPAARCGRPRPGARAPRRPAPRVGRRGRRGRGGLLAGQPRARVRRPAAARRPAGDEQVHAAELIVTALQNAVVAEVELVHAALCGAPGYPLPATVPEAVRELGRLTAVVGGESAALLEHVVRWRARNAAFVPHEMNDEVLHLVRQQLAPGSVYDEDDRLREVGAFAQLWWQRQGLPIGVDARRFPGRWSGS